jgi:primosomal protein N' (replication factor Y)
VREEAERYASVAVPVPVRREFTYTLGAELPDRPSLGSRVRVPFGARKVVGTIVGWEESPPEIAAKPIESVLPGGPVLDPAMLSLTKFVADYYLCSWGEAIEAALPPRGAATPRARREARRLAGARSDSLPGRAVAMRRALEAIPADGSGVAVHALTPAERRKIPALVGLGLVEVVEGIDRATPVLPERAGTPIEARPGPAPSAAQAAVLETLLPAVREGAYRAFLLYGATGSGKTEVYLRAAAECLRAGRSVLYLVPEIGLTPLLVSRIAERFSGTLAVLHSGLGRTERARTWDAVRRGERRFVVGARSAVFAPLTELGLVVVDEEQDGSYKQDERPRYHGRDVAVVRAREAGAVVLLGSATPSLESFQHARSGRYTLLALGGRFEERPLAKVRIVDMRKEYREVGEVRPLSREMIRALRECLGEEGQALVLRNRRGWAPSLYCPSCGNRISCTRCSLALTWHRSAGLLRCHACGLERPHPGACPTCHHDELREIGAGTEKVEDSLREALPGARIERMDRDTVRGRGAHEALLRRFDRGEIDVLVGTQMIAKGHDFPNVTLVGVLTADQSLGLPDFRAGERTFQLLTQVAGRAGRGSRPGRVVIQAFDPAHPILRDAASQDYETFFDREIAYRRVLRYPPLSALVQIVVEDERDARAATWAASIAAALRAEEQGRLLLTGPSPAPIERLRGRYRHQILVRSAGRMRLVGAVDRALRAVEGAVPRTAIVVDVDPTSVL